LHLLNGQINIVDFTLFNIGSSTYTEFSVEPEIIMPVYEKYPEYMTMKYGCIHSHNTMAVFFSGTDTSTLLEQAFVHNFFLSLIVNNRLDKIAKISFQGKRASTETFYNRIGNVMLPYTRTTEEEVVYVIDCNIENLEPVVRDEELLTQIEQVQKIEAENKAKRPVYAGRLGGFGEDDDFVYKGKGHTKIVQKSFDNDTKKQINMFEEKYESSKNAFKNKCLDFVKRLINIDYTGYATESMTLKEAWEFREEQYGQAVLVDYLEEVKEFCEDNLDDAFSKELQAAWYNTDNFRRLRALLAYNFHSVLDVKIELERKILEIIDFQLKELEKDREDELKFNKN
jgi:hypothetical protein